MQFLISKLVFHLVACALATAWQARVSRFLTKKCHSPASEALEPPLPAAAPQQGGRGNSPILGYRGGGVLGYGGVGVVGLFADLRL